MSPMSPSFMSGGQSNWPQSDWPKVQIPDFREKCPKCGNILNDVYGAIGGFPGHEHIHPSSFAGYQCSKCNRYFPIGEFLMLKLEKEKMREKARSGFAKNYWAGIRVIFLNPYLYLIVVSFMLISRSFWLGITAGIAVILLMSFLSGLFSRLAGRKLKFPAANSDKPPDSPPTP